MTLYLSGELNCVLLTIRLFFTSSSSQVQQVWQMNYSAAHSHGAYAEKECFQSNLTLPLHNRRESLKKKNNNKKWKRLAGFPWSPNLQACPANDLLYGSRCAGLSEARNQREESSGGGVSAPGRLSGPGKRGRALLQGSARTRFAAGDHVGARSVTRSLFWLPVRKSGEWSTGEWMARSPPAASWLRREHSAKQGVKTGNKKTWHVRSNVPLAFAKSVSL